MKQEIAQIALVVNDYDEAIKFYTEKLSFTLIEDTALTKTKRWVILAPPSSQGCKLLLAKAANEKQIMSVGNQTGGRVFLFLHTDDFLGDYKNMQAKGILFVREPITETWGKWLFSKIYTEIYGI